MAIQGALIRAIDYTEVQKDVRRLLGDMILDNKYISDPLRATYGYGNVVSSTGVVREQLADDLQMATLKSDVRKIAIHCGVEFNPIIANLPNIVTGSLIENEHLSAYEAAVVLLNTNRFNLGVGQFSDEVLNISNTRTTAWGITNGSSPLAGGNTIRHSFSLDFGTAAAARYFFNAGGQVRLSGSRSGGSVTINNSIWTNLLSSMGTVIFNHNSTSATGSGTGSSIGYYQLTNTPQQVFTRTGVTFGGVYSSRYVDNDYTVYVRTDFADNTLGVANRVFFDIYFNDDHATQIYLNDINNGSISSNVAIRRATGDNVSVSAPLAINSRELKDN